ncbi:MAG TPA: SRPBCC family protein [Methylotenera sp.]|nr:SRPBCC family protein [Methylotenera sp.]
MTRIFAAMLISAFGFIASASAAIDETIRLKESVEINASADKVWAKLGNFGDMSWHPAIGKTAVTSGKADEVGATRVLTLKDGGNVNEVLTSFDPASMTMKYEITESVLPVREYGATIKVEAAGDGKSIVTWRTMFKRKDPANPGAAGQDDAAGKAAITGVLQSGLANLKKISE